MADGSTKEASPTATSAIPTTETSRATTPDHHEKHNSTSSESASVSNPPISQENGHIVEKEAKGDNESRPVTAAEPPILGENEKTHVEGTDGEGGVDIDEEDDANVVYPGGLPLALLTLGLCLTNFAIALDNSILATAIPKITTVFPNALKDVGWYGSSYLLTTTALQPSFGRIYTHFNVRNTYLVGIVIFEIGSVICATAQSSVTLIVGRAIAGVGASALYSGGMIIVGLTVPLAKRPLFIACLSSMFGIASVVGPLLGGAFTDRLSWRWCFWINLPFGAIAVGTLLAFFHPPPRKESNLTVKQKILEMDLLGATFLMASIVCLLLALQWGGTTYSWKDSKVWGCLLGFGLLLIVFIFLQFRRGDRATIPPRIFLQRTVLWSSVYSCFLSMGLYVHVYFLPFYFQAIKGTTAEGSGIRTIPYLATIIISAMIVGGGITVFGFYKPFMIVGAAIFTVGAGTIYMLKVGSGAAQWIGYQLLSGIGAGAGIQIPFTAVQVVLNNKDTPSGTAIAIFFNSLGGAISISIAQNVFSNGLYKNIPVYAPTIPVDLVVSVGATNLRKAIEAIEPAILPNVLIGYMMAIRDAFIIAIVVGGISAIAAFGVEMKTVKGKKIIPGGAA